jgi:hypothetical protein
VTRGELDPGLVGASVPVRMDRGEPQGALGLVMSRERFSLADEARLVARLQQAAARIATALPEAAAQEPARVMLDARTTRRATSASPSLGSHAEGSHRAAVAHRRARRA